MLVRLAAHPDQIRWWAESTLNGFDTLDAETAIENAKADMRSLLAYLDRTNDAVSVLGVVPVEPAVRDELDVSDVKTADKPHLEIVRF